GAIDGPADRVVGRSAGEEHAGAAVAQLGRACWVGAEAVAWTRLLCALLPVMRTPSLPLPAMTLPAPASVPPIGLLAAPSRSTPFKALPRVAPWTSTMVVRVTSVPR